MAMPLRPDARPSMPSMRLIALVMNTTRNTVSIQETATGSSYIPNIPSNESTLTPAAASNSAARICATNFARYLMPMRSSAMPTRYIIIRAHRPKHSGVTRPSAWGDDSN